MNIPGGPGWKPKIYIIQLLKLASKTFEANEAKNAEESTKPTLAAFASHGASGWVNSVTLLSKK